MIKHVAFVLTINNPIYSELNFVNDLTFLQENGIVHVVSGEEGLGFGRTRHLQICLCFAKPKSWKEVKNIFPRAYIDNLRYSYVLACDYCKKEGFATVFGDMQIALETIHALKVKQEKRASLSQAKKIPGTIKGGNITTVMVPSSDSYWSTSSPVSEAVGSSTFTEPIANGPDTTLGYEMQLEELAWFIDYKKDLAERLLRYPKPDDDFESTPDY